MCEASFIALNTLISLRDHALREFLLWHFEYSLSVKCFVECLGICFLRETREISQGLLDLGGYSSV
jgi:hypothetical protein